MSVKTQEIIHKLNQLPEELQQEAIKYLNFLVQKYAPKSANEEQEAIIEEVKVSETISQKEENQATKTKKDKPSAEELQLDEEIEAIGEKKKDRLSPDWQDLKQAFKDEFF